MPVDRRAMLRVANQSLLTELRRREQPNLQAEIAPWINLLFRPEPLTDREYNHLAYRLKRWSESYRIWRQLRQEHVQLMEELTQSDLSRLPIPLGYDVEPDEIWPIDPVPALEWKLAVVREVRVWLARFRAGTLPADFHRRYQTLQRERNTWMQRAVNLEINLSMVVSESAVKILRRKPLYRKLSITPGALEDYERAVQELAEALGPLWKSGRPIAS